MRLDKNGIIIPDDYDVTVNRVQPHPDEARLILIHVIKQAIDDYQMLRDKSREDLQEAWVSARDFLFDDDYYIKWGDLELNLEQICDLVGYEIGWIRHRVNLRIYVKLQQPDGILTVRKE